MNTIEIAAGRVLVTDRPRPQAQAIIMAQTGYEVEVRHHPVRVGEDGIATLEAGRALRLGDVRDWLATLDGQKKQAGLQWVSDRLLAQGGGSLLWYTPPAVRPMYFHVAGKRVTLKAVPWPGLIFHAAGDSLNVAAYRGRGRPKCKTPLYHSPLMNVGPLGQVCLGSATRPRSHMTVEQQIAVWNDAIFETNFTHVNQPATLLPGNKRKKVSNAQHLAFWKKLENLTAFPSDRLNPMGRRLEEFCRVR
ncbi:hypothetical protein BJI67_15795 (plasmid) [Acidihalobacter aeolianus]|uniref:PRTRC system protein B n=1 Tax=Acidihalobacter aeolianus TaxID=2792603 RepID=A0A1D8KCL8_9GAMM|nr:PRTRC system protein B [Acidihalobacter aeolianus]AOV18707.1 hypothetical protein BJI67_15795 [Acidihalobacter aeolianus]